ncbi:TonB-dependent receptor [Porphyromonas pogonae]|uniref:TonB-dependent receptor n=1 Tax=Porphyromonas pogonae TaxID=867595 RepID=UPI002E767289|nr:TonB-dependent receptor [Porphyromonas pogonae]
MLRGYYKFFFRGIIIFVSLLLCHGYNLTGQSSGKGFTIRGAVLDAGNGQAVEYSSVRLFDDAKKLVSGTITSTQGEYVISKLPKGWYIVVVSNVSYQNQSKKIYINSDTTLNVRLSSQAFVLGDVVVTATENKTIRTTSTINKEALSLLQPSSFTDVLELLPGGKAVDPVMNRVNTIHLRENNTPGDKYQTGALGTAFVIDGARISTNADMQDVRSSAETFVDNKSSVGKGVDMRTLTTDDIEQIKIERGIPSVEYGDLTDGLVRIIRKKGAKPWELRFKSDLTSKLYYAGKGWAWGNNSLNTGVSYIHSTKDPRDPLEDFKRIAISLRNHINGSAGSVRVVWESNLDFTGSFDDYKKDSEQITVRDDYFKNSRNRYSWTNRVLLHFKEGSWISSLNSLVNLSLGDDKMKRRRTVYLNRPLSIPNVEGEGEFIGSYISPEYISYFDVKGTPFTMNAKVVADGRQQWGNILSLYKIGAEWQTDKNFGRGLNFDRFKPPYPSDMRSRNRKFSAVPAFHQLSVFGEITTKMQLGKHQLNAIAGVRVTAIPGIDHHYKLNNQIAFDPRLSIQWILPDLSVCDYPLQLALEAGYGKLSKAPGIAQLYPESYYDDLVELNYYHPKPELRRIVFRSYETDPANYKLSFAANHKLEFRIDASYRRHNLSLTVYRENLDNGFRAQSYFRALEYKRYDYSGIDHEHITVPPDYTKLPFVRDTLLKSTSMWGNGSRTEKRGIEFQYSSPRLPIVLTRITFNGAYFHNNYENSQPIYKKPSIILDGNEYPYVGLYRFDDGYTTDYFGTNLMLDTYVPRLGMNFMLSMQGTWYDAFTSKRIAEAPISYIDKKGIEHPYNKAAEQDPVLQWLIDKSNGNERFSRKSPVSVFFNFKGSKSFGKHLKVALFVNRLFDYLKTLNVNGFRSRRQSDPYFGMEINVNI